MVLEANQLKVVVYLGQNQLREKIKIRLINQPTNLPIKVFLELLVKHKVQVKNQIY